MKSPIYFCSVLIVSLLLISGCKKEKFPPKACFTVEETVLNKGEFVIITDCSFNPASYHWDFGDGTTYIGAAPYHAYTSAGTYIIKLTVTNSDGSDTKTVTVQVRAVSAADYAGSFSCSEVCTLGNYTYVSNITALTPSTIRISNFGDFGYNLTASISDYNITLPTQTVGGVTFSGTGTLATNLSTINLNYHATDGSVDDNCAIIYTRQ